MHQPRRILIHCARALLLAFGVGLAAAPTAVAIPTCSPNCPQPVPVTASITGPATATRTLDNVTFSAGGSHGGAADGVTFKPITKIEWDLDGNGSFEHDTGTTTTKSVTYPSRFPLGNLTVKVRVTSQNGSATSSKTIRIDNRAPTAGLSVSDDTPVTGQTVRFTGEIADSDSAWVMEAWKFNGVWCGPVSGCSGLIWDHAYSTPGTYTQWFSATDADNAETQVSRTVTVRAAPVANLTAPDRALVGEDVTFDASGSTGSGPRTYRWDVDGDEQNGFEVDGGTTPTLTRSFQAGDHGVRVQVSDHEGNSAVSAKRFVTVHALPNADFSYTPAQPVVGQTVNFESLSTDDGWIVLHQWDLDGDDANGFEYGSRDGASRVFTTAGQHVVRLRVNDNDGGEKTVTKTITVKEKPVVEDPEKDEPKDEGTAGGDKPAGGPTSGSGVGTTSGGAGATAGTAAVAVADQSAAAQQPRLATGPTPVAKTTAKKKAKKRCAAPKGKKARGKKAQKRCGKAKKARRAKKRR
jgi:hypothetical protein